MTEQQMFLAAIAALSTVVVTLFGMLAKRITAEDRRTKAISKRLDECETDRQNLWKHITKLEVMLAKLTRVSCADSACPVRKVVDEHALEDAA